VICLARFHLPAFIEVLRAFLGLGVARIGRVLRFTEPEIVSPIQLPQIKLPSETMPFLRGWIAQPQGLTNNLYLLDAEAIAIHNFTLQI
jgi:twitching motility protein PilI